MEVLGSGVYILVVSGGRYILVGGGWWWMVVGGSGWWWIYFGWWWVVVSHIPFVVKRLNLIELLSISLTELLIIFSDLH